MPRVSIVMPVYNKEQFIDESIQSVLNQSFQDFEIICVNDGSTDNSLQIINKYAKQDERIKAITVANGGVSRARNLGLDQVTGDWIWFFDCDDLVNAEFLSHVFINNIESYDVCFGAYEINTVPPTRVFPEITGDADSKILIDSFFQIQYKNGYYGYVWNKLIKASVIKSNDIRFDESIKLAEDLLFMVKVYECSRRFYFVEHIAIHYRMDFISEKLKNVNFLQQIHIQYEIKKWAESIPAGDKWIKTVNRKITEYSYAHIFTANELHTSIKGAMYELNQERILSSLSTDGLSTFQKAVIWNLQRNNTFVMNAIFKSRNMMRAVYRKLRK